MPRTGKPRLFRPHRLWLFLGRSGLGLALAATLAAALAPSRDTPQLFPWDKAEHWLAFYVLSGLAAAAFPRIRIQVIVVMMLALGGAIELVQGTALIHRDADLGDWAADAFGVACALLPLLLGRWRREMKDVAAAQAAHHLLREAR
jgi:hypothetical protein